MSYAVGRDDESEMYGQLHDVTVLNHDYCLCMFMLVNDAVMQVDAGKAAFACVVQDQPFPSPPPPTPPPRRVIANDGPDEDDKPVKRVRMLSP